MAGQIRSPRRAHTVCFVLSITLQLVATVTTLAQTATLSGIINHYARVIAIDYCTNSLTIDNPSSFIIGSRALLIQMQGAVVDTTSTPTFGTITNYRNAGNYEIVTIENVTGNVITMKTTLLREYDQQGTLQLVTLPHYENATVVGAITPKSWDGTTGGVLALEVTGTLTLQGDIEASGTGFRGGKTSINYDDGFSTDTLFVPISSGRAGQKGEGIAAPLPRGECGRGRIANGGGGGNAINAAGGGGACYGSGGKGGGEGGWGFNILVGGVGGQNLYEGMLRDCIFFGGGGGGGQQNEGSGTDGGNGGGIILVRAGTLIGNGHTIAANGVNAQTAGIDGAGGGGSGGTVLLDLKSVDDPFTIQARGGHGGNTHSNYRDWYLHPPGGGGGGGVVITTESSLPSMVGHDMRSGEAGRVINENSSQYNTTDGASSGSAGGLLGGRQIPESFVPFAPVTAHAGSDVTICSGSLGESIGSSATGGSGPYHYQWQPSTGLSSDTLATPSARPDSTTTYSCVVTDTHGCTAVDSVLVTVIQTGLRLVSSMPDGSFNIDSTLPTTYRCQDLLLENRGNLPIVIEAAMLARNIEFSVPPSQLPLTIPSGSFRSLTVCFAPQTPATYRDTLSLDLDCLHRIPLLSHGSSATFTGTTDCGPIIRVQMLPDSEYALIATAPYPNPGAGQMTIDIIRHVPAAYGEMIERCALYNCFGDLVTTATYRQSSWRQHGEAIEEQGAFTFDVARLPQGLYFAKVNAVDTMILYPVIIRR